MSMSRKKVLCSQLTKSKECMVEKYEESSNRRFKPKFLYYLLISLASCSLVLSPVLSLVRIGFSLIYSMGNEKEGLGSEIGGNVLLPRVFSSPPSDTICCERSNIKYDTCVMKGDVRTHPSSTSLILYSHRSTESASGASPEVIQHETIRPYTRKWETTVMEKTVSKVDLIVSTSSSVDDHRCDVQHNVPAVLFSTGGFTGNLFHEFNDGIVPLYITTQHLNSRVVLVILDYHDWWIMKYTDILSQLSDFPPIDLANDEKIHCFPEAIVGLTIHDELNINPTLMRGNKTISDFRDLLDRAYWPRIRASKARSPRPKLTIVARKGSRSITNQKSVVRVAEEIGFEVKILWPVRTTDLALMYGTLNSSRVMVGVHGPAMTHFLFMRPSSVFIQVVPLGTDWSSNTYYGEPSRKLGLRYIGYKIMPNESSLYQHYSKDDPILMDPTSFAHKGWEFTKKTYLNNQTVTLDLTRFRDTLLLAYNYVTAPQNLSFS